jgi:hypothetical protein
MGACVSLPELCLEYLLLLMFVALTGYCKSRVIRLDTNDKTKPLTKWL